MVLELESRQTQIQRILQSKAFRTSEVQRNLLSYLAEKSISGNADGLKEYTVGLDVFAKPASYDPRQESTVRMHVARLRQKLADYYRSEGVDDSIIVDLPKGGFKVTFDTREIAVSEPIEPPPSKPFYRREVALVTAFLVTLLFAAYFGTKLWRVEQNGPSIAGWTPELQQLWSPLLASNRPLMICLSTPSSGRTGIGTATGAFLLGQFLGQRKDIQVTPSDQLSMPDIAMGNVVFLGPQAGNRQTRAIPSDQQLLLEANGIRNLDPRPGEPAFLSDLGPNDPQDTAESYALVSLVPGLYGNGEILYFSGNETPAVMGAVQAFTDPAFARTLVAKMKAGGGSLPQFYQVVLKVRSMDNMPVEKSYVLHHELPASPQTAAASKP